MQAAEDLAAAVGTARACACLGVPRASLYRRRGQASAPLPPTPRPAPPLQLSEHERTQALALLYGERFVDASPYTLYATLLDERRYLCSVRTLYRLLAAQGAGRERRNQLRHPAYTKPELLAMTSKPLALLLADLGVPKTHSRPYVSDDNPFSEAQFKTLKYRPDFPQCFGSIADARAHCRAFFPWYNNTHRHAGIAFMTPEVVHYGRAAPVLATRTATLDAAFAANPNRFKGQRPTPQQLPDAVWITPPATPEAGPDEPSEQPPNTRGRLSQKH